MKRRPITGAVLGCIILFLVGRHIRHEGRLSAARLSEGTYTYKTEWER